MNISVKKNAQKRRSLRLRLDFTKREFQATKSGTSRERDNISRILECCILWFVFLLSIILRISLYKVETSDYHVFLHPWYNYIQAHGGFAALKDSFSDYNVPYLYLLALTTYLPIQPIVAIKSISIVFDPLLAFFSYLILRLKYTHGSVPTLGAIAILFTPTVFINSAAWGQCDAIYTACCLGSLYFLMSKHPAWACFCFGIALSFKPQAMFFLPVLIVLLLTRKLPIKWLLLIPVIYLAMLMPARLAGRDAWSLLTIYGEHIKENAWALTINAPTFYQWLPAKDIQDWVPMGMILATMMVALINFLTLKSRKTITPDTILKLTLVFALVIPFLLPTIHDRFFYLADIVSIICAFYFPRYWYVAVIEQLCSLMSYAIAVFNTEVVNLAYVAFAVLFLVVITLADLVKTLYPDISVPATMPIASSDDTPSEASDTVVSPKVPIFNQ